MVRIRAGPPEINAGQCDVGSRNVTAWVRVHVFTSLCGTNFSLMPTL